jgi:hypothetical protein
MGAALEPPKAKPSRDQWQLELTDAIERIESVRQTLMAERRWEEAEVLYTAHLEIDQAWLFLRVILENALHVEVAPPPDNVNRVVEV